MLVLQSQMTSTRPIQGTCRKSESVTFVPDKKNFVPIPITVECSNRGEGAQSNSGRATNKPRYQHCGQQVLEAELEHLSLSLGVQSLWCA
jgi:hypothetical protein